MSLFLWLTVLAITVFWRLTVVGRLTVLFATDSGGAMSAPIREPQLSLYYIDG